MMDVFTLIAAALIGTVVSILRSALTEEFPAMAEWLVRFSARRMPCDQQDRYREEWLAELDAVAKKHSKPAVLLWAIRILVRAKSTARGIGPTGGRSIAAGVMSSAGVGGMQLSGQSPKVIVEGSDRLPLDGKFQPRCSMSMPIDRPLGSFRNRTWSGYRLTTGKNYLVFPASLEKRLAMASDPVYWRFMARQLRRVGLALGPNHAWRAFAD